MPSVVGLLEQRELTARRRVDDLREEADRLQTELPVAEREWNEWVIARSRVGEVLAPGNDAVVGPAASEGLPAPGVQPARPEPAEAANNRVLPARGPVPAPPRPVPATSYFSSGSQARSRSSSPASPSTCKESAWIRSYR